MTDKELLELAAKAASLNVWWGNGWQSARMFRSGEEHPSGIITGVEWDPLNDDGDALRLAVKAGLRVGSKYRNPDVAIVEGWKFVGLDTGLHVDGHSPFEVAEPFNGNPSSATRRAITRAAAEIGKSLTDISDNESESNTK